MKDLQDLSLGILPLGAQRHITAAPTFVTACGGVVKAFNSVKLVLFKVLRASVAAFNAGSALFNSISQIFCLSRTSEAIFET